MAPRVKLPVLRSVKVVWLLPFVHWPDLLRVLWLPFMLVVAARATESWAAQVLDPQSSLLLLGIPFVFLTTSLAVAFSMAAWHRALFPHPPLPVGLLPIRPGRAMWTYLFFWLVLIFTLFLAWNWGFALFSGSGDGGERSFVLLYIGAYVPVIPMLYPLLRLGLLLPEVAHEGRADLSVTWQRGVGNGWRLVAIAILTALPLKIMAGLAPLLFAGKLLNVVPPEAVRIIAGGVSALITLLSAILAASLLSVAYQYLTRLQEGAAEEGVGWSTESSDGSLPVLRLASSSLAFLGAHLGDAVRLSWLPLAILLLSDAIWALLLPGDDKGGVAYSWILFIIFKSINGLALTLLLIPWHRLILFGEKPRCSGFSVPGKMHVSYAIRLLLMAAVSVAWLQGSGYLFGHLLADTGWRFARMLAVWSCSAIYLYLFSRVASVLPAAAVGETARPAQAWVLTRKRGWRATAVLTLVLIPTLVLSMLMSLVQPTFESWPWVISGARQLFVVLITVFWATAVSFVFRYLRDCSPVGGRP